MEKEGGVEGDDGEDPRSLGSPCLLGNHWKTCAWREKMRREVKGREEEGVEVTLEKEGAQPSCREGFLYLLIRAFGD